MGVHFKCGNERTSICGSTGTDNSLSGRTAMNMRAMILAGLLGSTIVAGPALAADTSKVPLVAPANLGEREAEREVSAEMWAVAAVHAAVVEGLVRRGAVLHGGSKAGCAPLMFAAQQGDVESACILIIGRASANDVRPKSGNSYTPLIIASA